ncbi:MAG: iron-sulfur cluster assembly accessory protein [Cyclobacteriaceae bacterium]|jgi:iron-sulfur cluster assembly protein|nr:iron-sulfur cluster assembly accessory protein [Flammeovirgaceae bacterium]MCZ8023414.1 iron-sulfur cluster assembly accessory protein [Cytophagales bacterium]MCZ8329163.1 iron-sulfur cluster assembly accessory protein [Cyclobacteriaceae bacterium]
MFSNFQPITITKRAAEEVKKIMNTKGIPTEYCLRIGVKGGGCGVSLLVGFDKPKETDQKFIINQIPVIIDKKHTMYVIGKEMDYLQTEQGQGFSFIQQNDINTQTES